MFIHTFAAYTKPMTDKWFFELVVIANETTAIYHNLEPLHKLFADLYSAQYMQHRYRYHNSR